MTTNISESLNNAMIKARELPICSMLEVLRMMLQRWWFFESRNEAAYQVTNFTKTVEGDHRQWQVPDDVLSIDILPPNVKRPVGRPKKIRIPSKMEFK
uniref:Uncharacterized protein n=1 Tax=Cucumis sativus TaxID=3659 RepID=A0A0A0LBD9_CUCSA